MALPAWSHSRIEPGVGPALEDAIAVVLFGADAAHRRCVMSHGADYSSPIRRPQRGSTSSVAWRPPIRDDSLTLNDAAPAKWARTSRENTTHRPWQQAKHNPRRAPRLLALYDAAVAAAHPDVCLPPHLPAATCGRAALYRRRRQGRRSHGGGGGAALPRPRRDRPRRRVHDGPARGTWRRSGPGAPEPPRDRLGAASHARRRKRRGGRAHAGAGGNRRRSRPRARAAVGRRLGTVGGAGGAA